jgi:hypothetical protein
MSYNFNIFTGKLDKVRNLLWYRDGTNLIAKDFNVIIGDGGITNYMEIKSDGEINLHGTARIKETIKVFTSSELQRGITPPSSGAIGSFAFEQYTINDDSILNLAVLNARDEGTDIEVTFRWAIDEAYSINSAEVQWQVDWSVIPDDGSVALDNPTYFGTIKSGDINVPAIALGIQETTITIPGTNITNDDELGITLKRVALDDGNDPAVEPGMIIVGILAISDKLGEPL